MGVDHGGCGVFVTQQFLNSSYVVAVLEEVGGEGVAEGVGCDAFVYLGKKGGRSNRFLKGSFMDMVAACDSGFRVSI